MVEFNNFCDSYSAEIRMVCWTTICYIGCSQNVRRNVYQGFKKLIKYAILFCRIRQNLMSYTGEKHQNLHLLLELEFYLQIEQVPIRIIHPFIWSLGQTREKEKSCHNSAVVCELY